MKAKERALMNKLRSITQRDFIEVANRYSDYDCETPNAIVELKVRDKVYEEKLIELSKMARNLLLADEIGKSFVYVVEDPSGIYYANISEIREEILKRPPIKLKCPKTTEFSNNEYITKACYTIKMKRIYG